LAVAVVVGLIVPVAGEQAVFNRQQDIHCPPELGLLRLGVEGLGVRMAMRQYFRVLLQRTAEEEVVTSGVREVVVDAVEEQEVEQTILPSV
jgi:hypothetical protein